MSGFDDLDEFARDHQPCGQITRTDSEPRSGRVQLTLACRCGATRARWVATEEIRDLPGVVTAPAPGGAAGAPRRRRRGAAPSGLREGSGLGVDRNSLEDVMRRALEEVEHAGQAPGRRDRRGIEDVMQSALRELDPGQGRPRQAAAVSGGRPPEQVVPRSRRALAKAAMAAILLVAAIAAVWSAIRSEREAHTAVTASVARAGATPLSEGDRGIVGQSLATLRELQSVGRPDVPTRVYLNRVSFAQAELDRAIAGLTDSALRARVKEVLALHVLAATAWRAKTVNERPQWEAAGQDPAVSLCPTVERILNSDEPRAMSRAEWRGVALAATVPLLWDCAADHLAAIEKDVRAR